MEKIQLEISLSDDELKTAMSRYHYEDADFLLFSQVYREIMEQLQPVGMYVYGLSLSLIHISLLMPLRLVQLCM